MQRLIQDTLRRALADELLFGRLVDGGRVSVDIDEAAAEKDKIKLDITPPEPRPKKKEGEDAAA
jgi:ATP-dependent Clp protease ATP-binding subunit ClpA